MPRPTTVPLALTVASTLIFAASFFGGSWGEWVFVLVTPLFPVLLILLATPRRPGRGAIQRAGPLALGALLTLTAVAIRRVDASADPAWIMGMPVSMVWMGLGLVVLPLVWVGWSFARGFVDTGTASARRLPSDDSRGRKS